MEEGAEPGRGGVVFVVWGDGGCEDEFVGEVGEVEVDGEVVGDDGEEVGGGGEALGVGEELVVEAFLGVSAELGAVRVVLGGLHQGAAEDGAARVCRGADDGGGGTGGGGVVGSDAGFECDGLADGAGEAGEEEAVVRRAGFWRRRGCGLGGGGFGLGGCGGGGGPVLQGLLGGGFGEVHGDFGEAGEHAEVALGTLGGG